MFVTGKYQNEVGRVTCKACGAGRFVDTLGSVAAANCIGKPPQLARSLCPEKSPLCPLEKSRSEAVKS